MRLEQLEAAYNELVRMLTDLTNTVNSLRRLGNAAAADAANSWRYTLASLARVTKEVITELRGGGRGPWTRMRACRLADEADRSLSKAEEPAYYFIAFRSIRVIATIRELARDLCWGDEQSLGLYREVRKL